MGEVRLPAGGAACTQAKAYVDSVLASGPQLDRLRLTSDAFLEAAKGQDRQALTVAGNDLRIALDGFRASRAKSDTLAVQYGLNLCGNLDSRPARRSSAGLRSRSQLGPEVVAEVQRSRRPGRR